MIKPKNRLFCRIDGLTSTVREQKRLNILKKLGLLETETVPVFDEATQTAARFLETPICILGLVVKDKVWFKSAVGLSRIGLMNQLAAYRRLPIDESFSIYVVDSQQDLVLEDTFSESVFASTSLVQHYGIRSYLGTPLITTEGQCIGALEVMDTEPRQFTSKDVEFLALTARWCLREFERNYLLKNQAQSGNVLESSSNAPTLEGQITSNNNSHSNSSERIQLPGAETPTSTNAIKVRLLGQLTQDLRTPLTSVIGMASVLRRELYGPLTTKQKEYLEIIHNSGQHLISLVEEIVNLGVLDENSSKLQMTYVDIEMLCQQVINGLGEVAQQQQQELRLSVEPGNRIWLLDKEKVRQALYYLTISVLDSSEAGGEVRVHVSRKNNFLNIAVWSSHPWLGDGLPQVELYTPVVANGWETMAEPNDQVAANSFLNSHNLTSASLLEALSEADQTTVQTGQKSSRELLGLLLSCHLIELHSGQIMVQGSPESGYRYVFKLPKVKTEES